MLDPTSEVKKKMTKLLYCQDCKDIVASRGQNDPRWCQCGRHAIWRSSPRLIHIFDQIEGAPPSKPRAYILAITNHLLDFDGDIFGAEETKKILADLPDRSAMKLAQSLATLYRPGHGDTSWAQLSSITVERALPLISA